MKEKKNPFDDKITGSIWSLDSSGFLKKVTLLPLYYVDCALLITK